MKRTNITLLAAALCLLAIGCNRQPKEFSYHTYKGERSWQIDLDDSTTSWVANSYELQWPDKGCLSATAERELLKAVFGSYAGGDIHRSCENFLNSQGLLEDAEDTHYPCYQVDAVPDTIEHTEQQINVFCESTDRLATVTVTSYIFPQGAAHGSYDIMPIVFDRQSGERIHLEDIVDTNQLGHIVARAIDRLPANSDVKECLFDEFVGLQSMPVSKVFTINDAMDTVRLVYGLYWLTPYACGIQEVALPVAMLRENMALTDRGQKLFAGE